VRLSLSFFNELRDARWNSRLVRRVLGMYYREGREYRVPFGPLRGLRLRYNSTINYHAMLGLWEVANFRVLTTLNRNGHPLIAPDATVCDVGANIGLFSLWFARQYVPQGRVYAFEAAPQTLERLRDHLSLNSASNIEVVPFACTDRIGPVEFFLGHHHHTSSLNAKWAGGDRIRPEKISVPGMTLDEFFLGAQPHPCPHFIKMDIEGGGVFALRGCDRVVAKTRPLFLIESHTPDEDCAIRDLIRQHDYAAYRVDNNQWVTALDQVHPHPQGVWGTLLLCPSERRTGIVAAFT
jgi:FkbM family methyltransferase